MSEYGKHVIDTVARQLFEAQQQWDDPLSFHSEFTWTGLTRRRPEEAERFTLLAVAALNAIDALYEEDEVAS